jgi:hypothetical protein
MSGGSITPGTYPEAASDHHRGGRHVVDSSESRPRPMRVNVGTLGAAAPPELEVMSPELALIDPELGRAARALLPSPSEAAFSRLVDRATFASLEYRGGATAAPHRVPERHSRRLLVGVAAATMLALLLFDVRVEVGERPAAADSSGSVVGVGGPAPATTPAPGTTPARATTPAPATTAAPRSAGPSRKAAASRPADRRFAWAPVPGATGYHVEFFRGPSRVLSKETVEPLLTVPAQWTVNGRKRSLRPGTYRWYVWAIVGGRLQSQAVVQTTVSIPGR